MPITGMFLLCEYFFSSGFLFSALVSFQEWGDPSCPSLHLLHHIFKRIWLYGKCMKAYISLIWDLWTHILKVTRQAPYWMSHPQTPNLSILQVTLEDTYISFFLWKIHFHLNIWKIFKKELETSANLEESYFLVEVTFSCSVRFWDDPHLGRFSHSVHPFL